MSMLVTLAERPDRRPRVAYDAPMSELGPRGDNPFEGLPMFRDLARLFAGQGPVNWDVARQIAHVDWPPRARPSPTSTPSSASGWRSWLRVADLHVSDATGLSTSIAGGLLSVAPGHPGRLGPAQTLEAYRPFLERLATALADAGETTRAPAPTPPPSCWATWARWSGPVLLGMQSGYMVGHLGRRALGQYDLPVPRAPADQLLVVPANLDAFAEEWADPGRRPAPVGLPAGAHPPRRAGPAPRPGPAVGAWSTSTSAASRSTPTPSRPASATSTPPTRRRSPRRPGNPETLLGIVQTPAQREVAGRIETLLAAIAGYVDHVLDTVGHGWSGSYGQLTEALRRRRVESSEGDPLRRAPARAQLGAAQYEKGHAFVHGRGGAGRRGGPGPAVDARSGSCPRRPSWTPPASGWPASTCPSEQAPSALPDGGAGLAAGGGRPGPPAAVERRPAEVLALSVACGAAHDAAQVGEEGQGSSRGR